MKYIITFIFCFSSLLFSFIDVGEIDLDKGTIQFIGDAGSENIFTVQDWEITSLEMDNGMAQIKLQASLNISSITTSWKDLEKEVKRKKDYFYMKKFPTAFVSIDGATQNADGSYSTVAQLTLKKITKPVKLNFTYVDGQVKGSGVIQRRDFKFVGKGPKEEVPIMFDINLTS